MRSNSAFEPTQVLTASTGVIGKALEIDKIEAAVPELVDRATEVADGFALAILTTDLVPKSVTTTVKLSQAVKCASRAFAKVRA